MKHEATASMSDETQTYFGWIMAAVSTVIATLSGIVAQFYKKQVSDYEKNEASLTARITHLEADYDQQRNEVKDCHKQREEIRIELTQVKTRLEIIESQMNCVPKAK